MTSIDFPYFFCIFRYVIVGFSKWELHSQKEGGIILNGSEKAVCDLQVIGCNPTNLPMTNVLNPALRSMPQQSNKSDLLHWILPGLSPIESNRSNPTNLPIKQLEIVQLYKRHVQRVKASIICFSTPISLQSFVVNTMTNFEVWSMIGTCQSAAAIQQIWRQSQIVDYLNTVRRWTGTSSCGK